MPTVFPDGPHEDESIHFDLDGPTSKPIRIREKMGTADAHWEAKSIETILSEYPGETAEELLLEALRYGQGDFSRDGDTIIYESTSLPGVELVYDIADKQYRDAADGEDGGEDGRVLAVENLATEGLLRYEGTNQFLVDAHRGMFTTFLSKHSDTSLFPEA